MEMALGPESCHGPSLHVAIFQSRLERCSKKLYLGLCSVYAMRKANDTVARIQNPGGCVYVEVIQEVVVVRSLKE